MLKGIDKIFITHYSPLKDRKERLLPIIQSFGNDFEFIEEEPALDDLCSLFDFDEYLWRHKIELLYSGHHPYRPMKDAEISLVYKHRQVYEKIREQNIQTALVLEDDVLFEEDFENRFNQQLLSSPKGWDCIFPGSGCNLHIPNHDLEPGRTSYRKTHPASKCTDSYLITGNFVKRMLETMPTHTLPIDYEMSYQFFVNSAQVYWWEPTLIRQGSQVGLYRSEIQ